MEFKGINFRLYRHILVPNLPPHIDINLSEEDVKFLLRKSNALFLQYVSEFDELDNAQYWYVIKDGKSSLEELDAKKRYEIRRALKNCLVRKVDADFIAESGYEVYKKAFKRYNAYLKPVSKEEYVKERIEFKNDKRRDFWAVFNKEDNRLIAYAQTIVDRDSCNYSQIKFDPEFLKLYPSSALIFEMNNYYLNQLGLKYVTDGSRAINHQTNIQNYLISKFNFRKAYCKLNIHYNLIVKIFVRILYPFRKLFASNNNSITSKINTLMMLEEIRRSYGR